MGNDPKYLMTSTHGLMRTGGNFWAIVSEAFLIILQNESDF